MGTSLVESQRLAVWSEKKEMMERNPDQAQSKIEAIGRKRQASNLNEKDTTFLNSDSLNNQTLKLYHRTSTMIIFTVFVAPSQLNF